MKQGEIWWVDFEPSVGREYKKKRPAVIITADNLIGIVNTITVLPISSNIDNCWSDDVRVIQDKDNGLYSDSVVKVLSICTFDKGSERFIKKMGKVNEYILEQIQKYLKIHFGIK